MSSSMLRRDPLAGLPALDRLFGSMFTEPAFHGIGLEEGTLPLDISETESEVIVRASVPGFSREQIDVEVHDAILTIKAAKTEETEERGERYYRRERRVGSMSRRVALPSIVHDTEAKAELKNGELTLRLPKEAKARPRKITIE
ncbi:MAG: Hsp20/alpha crystallin family protein [Phycisphaerales bacterium]|nr:Hsp20/alpha crystallin family protein [Phycisphaerales bacterium]